MAIPILIVFVVLNSALKSSLWRWPWRWAHGAALGGFAYACLGAASQQSKTRLALLLASTPVLQNLSVLVTAESVLCIAFCFLHLCQGHAADGHTPRQLRRRRAAHGLLMAYPVLLLLPALFYLLAQTLFVAVGAPFRATGLLFAASVAVGLPLLAQGAKWLMPDAEGRVELHLLLSLLVCVLGWLATQSAQMLYAAPVRPFSWERAAGTAAMFLSLFLAGLLAQRVAQAWRGRRGRKDKASDDLPQRHVQR